MYMKNFLANFRQMPFFYRFLTGSLILIMAILAVAFIPRILFKPALMTVVGQGEMEFTPTEVSMIVTSVSQNAQPAVAIDQGEANVKTLIDLAKKMGGEGVEIDKSFYQVQPTAGVNGIEYQVANAFSVKVDNPTVATGMIKAFYNSGAITVTNVVFSSSDDKKLELEARKMAVKDAKMQARSIARASGKFLGRMLTIADDNLQAETNISKENLDGSSASSMSKAVSITFEVW
jgi:uncharacterized protein YggE